MSIKWMALICSFWFAALGQQVYAKEAPVSDESWPSYTEVLAPYVDNAEWLPEEFKTDPQLRQEVNWFLSYVNAMGFFSLIYQDASYPDFWPVYNQAFPIGFANPDDAYYMAVVDDRGVYRISGHRGTVRMLDFQISSNTHMAYGYGAESASDLSPPNANYDIDQAAHIAADGTFDVILSPERPQGYKGDWWKLHPGSVFILVRQRAYDWLNEVDARIAIERLDVPAAKPRMSAKAIESKVKQQGVYLHNVAKFMLQFRKGLLNENLVNAVQIVEQPAGVSSQKYILGLFDLQPDEALILETDIPDECRYWMFHLTDQWMSTIDPMNRQTSLNGLQARLDGDGKFRAVISEQDPGVPNWLDTIAYVKGAIVGRWTYCNSSPVPTVKKVLVKDVRKHLPSDTPHVSVEARDDSIRLRRKGAQLRRRW